MRQISVKVSNDAERDAVLKNFEACGCRWGSGDKPTFFHPYRAYPYYLNRHVSGKDAWIGHHFKPLYKEIPVERFVEKMKETKKVKKITICSDGKTVTATDERGRTGVAKCSPEDEFSLGYGAKLAIERMDGIKVGDDVVVIDSGRGYSTYSEFFSIHGIDAGIAARFEYGHRVKEGTEARVLAIHKHEWGDVDIAVIEERKRKCFETVHLVGVDGLAKE